MASQKYIGSIGDTTEAVDVEAVGEGRYIVTIDGTAHEVDARRFEGGTWSLLIDGQSYDTELEVASGSESEGRYNVLLRRSVISLTMRDERQIRMGLTTGVDKRDGPQTIESPMPGKIVKIHVAVDDEVEEGQPLIVIEAMKMENELCAHAKARVTKVMVKEGQAVEAHAKLIGLA